MSEFSLGTGANIPVDVRGEAISAGNTGGFGFENYHRNARIVAELTKAGKQVNG